MLYRHARSLRPFKRRCYRQKCTIDGYLSIYIWYIYLYNNAAGYQTTTMQTVVVQRCHKCVYTCDALAFRKRVENESLNPRHHNAPPLHFARAGMGVVRCAFARNLSVMFHKLPATPAASRYHIVVRRIFTGAWFFFFLSRIQMAIGVTYTQRFRCRLYKLLCDHLRHECINSNMFPLRQGGSKLSNRK